MSRETRVNLIDNQIFYFQSAEPKTVVLDTENQMIIIGLWVDKDTVVILSISNHNDDDLFRAADVFFGVGAYSCKCKGRSIFGTGMSIIGYVFRRGPISQEEAEVLLGKFLPKLLLGIS